jgi:hypothetical protein
LCASAVSVAGSPNISVKQTWTIGTSAQKVLNENKNRAEYFVVTPISNAANVYHGYDNLVTSSSLDIITPGGKLEDTGDWITIHRGEVWLIADAAGQSVTVTEIVKVKD